MTVVGCNSDQKDFFKFLKIVDSMKKVNQPSTKIVKIINISLESYFE